MTVGILPVTRACDRLPGCVQVVKVDGRRLFVVESSHFYMRNRGDF